jgi:hypothetical protein
MQAVVLPGLSGIWKQSNFEAVVAISNLRRLPTYGIGGRAFTSGTLGNNTGTSNGANEPKEPTTSEETASLCH